MAELWGAIERGLGSALSAIYDVIPSYGVAIILLTVGARLLLYPLTVKQIRSMTAMTKLQPKMKEIQQKHKGDRQKMNEEVMKLYKEHGVNPMGGCLPLLAQMPVFIALFAVLRAAVPISVATAEQLETPAAISVDTYSAEQLKTTFCRPTDETVERESQTLIVVDCRGQGTDPKRFAIGGFTNQNIEVTADSISVCVPFPTPGPEGSTGEPTTLSVRCQSALGTGHLPRSGDLFGDITADRASFLSMRLACSARQIGDEVAARQCTSSDDVGGLGNQVPYYLLIALIVVTAFFQARQMAKRATGQAAQQQKMMSRILPIFFGFISLGLPAGTNVYFLTTNLWTIGQQAMVLKHQEGASPSKQEKKPKELPETAGGPDDDASKKGMTPKKGRPTPKRKRR